MNSKTDNSAESNPAVRRCMNAWRKACDNSLDEQDEDEDEGDTAALAYRDAMPPLVGVRNIRNFIACVTHGCLIGAIDRDESSRLIYAAQIAYATRRKRTPKPKTPHSPAKNSHSGAIQAPIRAIQEPSSEPLQAP